MKLSLVIPVYNELATLKASIQRVTAVEIDPDVDKELVIVDDGSTDGSRELLAERLVRIEDKVTLPVGLSLCAYETKVDQAKRG